MRENVNDRALDRLMEKVWFDRTHKPDHVAPIGGTHKPKTTAQQKRRAANKAAKRARRRNR